MATSLLWAWTPDPAGRVRASAWQILRDRPADATSLLRLRQPGGTDPARIVLWTLSTEAVDLAVKALGMAAADEGELTRALYQAAGRCPLDDCALIVQRIVRCPACGGRKGGKSLSPKKLGQLRRAARLSGAKRKGKKRGEPITGSESGRDDPT